MWALSGRRFGGVKTVTERYECPPISESESSFIATPHLRGGEVYNFPRGCGCSFNGVDHNHLRLRGRPILSIAEVKLGSRVLSPSDYWIENRSLLGTTACDLCDAEITYTYGSRPPVAGERAARYLANQLVHSWSGDGECELPERVTSVSRQGVSYQLLDNQSFLDDARTGIYMVDLFLKAVNPDKARKPARVFSPDVPRGRRLMRAQTPQRAVGPNDIVVVPGQPKTWSLDLSKLGAEIIDGVSYVPRGQISSWNGATVFELGTDHFEINGMMLKCSLTAEDTRRAQLVGNAVWDLYAVAVADENTVISILTSNIFASTEPVIV
jgi:hypothetical protein